MGKNLLSPELGDALKKIVEHLHKNPGKADIENRKLDIECGRSYIRVWFSWTILVLLPNGDAFEPRETRGGRLPDYGKPCGNVIEVVKQKNWQRRVKFVLGQYNYPNTINLGVTPTIEIRKCERCSRTKNIKPTALGSLCGYCRGVDVRHMNSVRDLGGIPRIGNTPIHTNDQYYTTKRIAET